MLQEVEPLFQGLGFCLTLVNALCEETHELTKQEPLLGRGTRAESSRVREPRRTALPRGSVSGFMVMGLVSRWSLTNHSNSVFPGGTHITQPRWMLARGILGSGRTRGVSFRPFPNSSGCWWLISSVFRIRISCHKTTHANGYYGAWPGCAVSISVLPLTELDIVEQYERLPYGTLPFIIHTRTLLRIQGGTINNYAEKTSMLGF